MISSPVLIWNAQHDWAPFKFQFIRATTNNAPSLRTFGDFVGLQFGQVGSEFARQHLHARPTHTIRPGYTATLAVTQDIAFPGEWIEGVGMIPAAGRAR